MFRNRSSIFGSSPKRMSTRLILFKSPQMEVIQSPLMEMTLRVVGSIMMTMRVVGSIMMIIHERSGLDREACLQFQQRKKKLARWIHLVERDIGRIDQTKSFAGTNRGKGSPSSDGVFWPRIILLVSGSGARFSQDIQEISRSRMGNWVLSPFWSWRNASRGFRA